jgi:hypothetical protein
MGTDRTQYHTRLLRKGELEPPDDALARLTPGQRMELVWQVTLQAYAFKEGLEHEPRLRRDVGGLVRRRG